MTAGSGYAHENGAPSYRHNRHAGNIGDVWKHCALAAWLKELTGDGPPLTCIDCHAGGGRYELPPAGEWQAGIGRLSDLGPETLPKLLAQYLRLVRAGGFDGKARRCYPGSPLLALALLRPQDRWLGFETEPEVFAALQRSAGRDPRTALSPADGLAGMLQSRSAPAQTLVLIDPPWNAKADWQRVPAALLQAWRSAPDAKFMLWYPLKSYTRVAAMQQRLQAEGLPFVCLDLITTPLEHRRNRLNGSGLLLVNAGADLVAGLAAAGTRLAEQCAVFSGQWRLQCASFRLNG